jgi:hypothetical protein
MTVGFGRAAGVARVTDPQGSLGKADTNIGVNMASTFGWRRAMAGLVAATMVLGVAGACHPAAKPEFWTAGRRVGACSAGRTVDSLYVVRAAAEALSAPGAAGTLKRSPTKPSSLPVRLRRACLSA